MENKIEEKLKQLDKNYFHWGIQLDKRIEEKSWNVFYNNLSKERYYSTSNKPILTSKDNSLEDIEKLKNKFENIKSNYSKKIWSERLDLNFDIFQLYMKIQESISGILNGIGYSILGLIYLLLIFRIDTMVLAGIGIALLTIDIISMLLSWYMNGKIKQAIKTYKTSEEERLLKTYMKDKYLKGLKDEFTKKNRKKFVKENKEYRPKRKSI